MSSLRTLETEGASGGHSLPERPDPNNFRLHTHSRAEIYYFIRGGGIFHIEGSAYSLETGDLLVMQPAESHYIELDCTQPYRDRVSLARRSDPHVKLFPHFEY